jgi:hypothetical protein
LKISNISSQALPIKENDEMYEESYNLMAPTVWKESFLQQRFYRWELKSKVDAAISKISNLIDENGLDGQLAYSLC